MNLILFSLFFITGAGSLVLQVVWAKTGTVILGNTVSAAALVLCCFMAGIASGSWFFGNRADTHPGRLLRDLGFLQIGVAVGSLPGLFLFKAESFPGFSGFSPALSAVFFCASLLIPTVLMGGTFPVISKFMALHQDSRRINGNISGLYAINILGASAGVLLGGFFLLENSGITVTALLAMAAYGGTGCIALVLQTIRQPAAVSGTSKASPTRPGDRKEIIELRTVCAVMALSFIAGFAVFSYEMLYMRSLSLFWNSTVYSFSIVAAAFLSGSGSGSSAAALIAFSEKPRAGPLRNGFFYLCGAAIIAGAAVMGSLALWPDILSIADPAVPVPLPHTWTGTVLSKALVSMLLVFIPSFFLGALFIALVKTFNTAGTTGKNIGRLYAVNTIGGIFGSCIAGFVFIPRIGTFGGFVITTLLLFIAAGAGIVVWFSCFNISGVISLAGLLCAGICLAALVRSPWAPRPHEQVLYYKEGAAATAKIIDAPDGTRRLFCNFREEGNTGLDPVRYARLEAYLPLLLHPAPAQVLIIGMGTGITAGEACHYPATRSVRCAEISPEIAGGAAWFSHENRRIMSAIKFRLTINDGRHFLRRTGDRFDVIVMDLVNPGNNIGTLYSREFYRDCRSHLKTGGIFCQWISLVQCTEPALQTVLATFERVFPEVSVWCVGSGRLLAVIGGDTGGAHDFSELRKRFTQTDSLRETLDDIVCISPFTLASWYLMGKKEFGEYLQGSERINSDDVPYFEYATSKMGPRSAPTAFDHLPNLLSHRGPVDRMICGVPSNDTATLARYLLSREHLLLGGILNEQGKEEQSFKEFQHALRINPGNEDAQYLLGVSRLHELRVKERLARMPVDLSACQELAYIYCQNQRYDDAAAFLEKIILQRPEPVFYFTLGRVYEEKGDRRTAIAWYEKLLRCAPGDPEAVQRIQTLKTATVDAVPKN